MAIKPLPSQEVLRQLLRYDAETGKLYWLSRSPEHTPSKDPRGPGWVCARWNNRNAGKEAFTSPDRKGYRHGKINGIKYQAHRIIWKLVYGVEPEIIDHINRVTSDNRLSNLRSCTVAENSRNSFFSTGSSTYKGVRWVARDRIWVAQISVGLGRKINLGSHKDEISAARAYDRAAREHHGEFAFLNFPEEVQ